MIMKDVREKGVVVRRRAIFRAWITQTVFKIGEKQC